MVLFDRKASINQAPIVFFFDSCVLFSRKIQSSGEVKVSIQIINYGRVGGPAGTKVTEQRCTLIIKGKLHLTNGRLSQCGHHFTSLPPRLQLKTAANRLEIISMVFGTDSGRGKYGSVKFENSSAFIIFSCDNMYLLFTIVFIIRIAVCSTKTFQKVAVFSESSYL